jgi:hypothetical protein
MSPAMPQSAAEGTASPLIVIETVHGNAISVSMKLLSWASSSRVAGNLSVSQASITSSPTKN